jgi:redox-sensitive bicupin YhaK (pirin superfamily)
MGNGSVIRPGDVQRMSAGTGVAHSEFNASQDDPVHFLQIWVIPDRAGHEPGYEQKHFTVDDKRGRLRLVASADGREGSVSLNQDADLYAALLDGDESEAFEVRPGRDVWVHVARGGLALNGKRLGPGDGVAVRQPGQLEFTAGEDAEVLVFDLGRTG